MKTKTYDFIMYIFGCVSGFLTVSVFGAAFLFFFLLFLLTGVSTIFAFTFSMKYLIIFSSFMTIPILIYSLTYFVAVKLYSINNLQDVWVVFGHEVAIDVQSMEERREIDEWCEENCNHLYKMLGAGLWLFWNKSDAVAFKLRWS